MTTRRTVVLRPRATADLATTAGRITRTNSRAAADRWRQRVEAAVRSLANDAERWPEADEAADLGFDLRFRAAGRGRQVYRILFVYDATTVTVLRVRHAAQDRLTEGDL